MSKHRTFVDLCLNGEVLMDEIDEFVEDWHAQEDDSEPLHSYLGMSADEYSLWVEQPTSLRLILAARQEDAPLYEALSRYASLEPVAARAADPEAAKVVLEWLRKTGRIKTS